MKLWKTLFEAGVMAAGLVLVIITLSGKTQTIGLIASAVSLALFISASMMEK